MSEAEPGSADAALVEVVRGAPAAFYQFRRSPSGRYEMSFISSGFGTRYALEQGEPEETAARFISRIHTDDLARVRGAIERSAGDLKIFECEFRFRLPTGAEAWVEARSIPRRTPDGGVLWDGIATDITARKAAEAALRQSEKRFRSIVEAFQDAYVRTDLEGRFVMLSPSTAKMFGYSSTDELIGQPARVLYGDPEDRCWVLTRVREKGFVRDRNGRGRRKDGSTFWVSLNLQPWFDDEGRVAGMEGVARDISLASRQRRRSAQARSNSALCSISLLWASLRPIRATDA